MAVSELYQKGQELRRQLLGDAYVERVNQTAYADPMMKKFIAMATETVFGALWTRPGHSPSHGAAPGLDRGRADRGAPAPLRLRRRAACPRGDAHGEGGLRRD